MKNKNEKAAYLLDEIGQIDDRLIAEAMAFRPKKKRRYPLLVAAVCAALAAVLVITVSGAFAIGKIVSGVIGGNEPPRTDVQAGLGELLTVNADADGVETFADIGDVDLFDRACLIWRLEPDGAYYAKALTSDSLSELSAELGKGTAYGGNTAVDGLWISYGDGIVVSPYLKRSAGNVWYGELFDYAPEIEPSGGLVSCISDLFE